MSRIKGAALLLLLFCCPLVWAMGKGVEEPILPLTQVVGLDPGKVALGERLFHDPRLSGDESISCAHCHPLGR
ncbi:MAG: hypothetical protein B0D88_02290, partial [Candidatus Sedimenticola endophacoides]